MNYTIDGISQIIAYESKNSKGERHYHTHMVRTNDFSKPKKGIPLNLITERDYENHIKKTLSDKRTVAFQLSRNRDGYYNFKTNTYVVVDKSNPLRSTCFRPRDKKEYIKTQLEDSKRSRIVRGGYKGLQLAQQQRFQRFQKTAIEATMAGFLPKKPAQLKKKALARKTQAAMQKTGKEAAKAGFLPEKLAQLKKKALTRKTQAVQGQNNVTKSKQKAQSKSSRPIQGNSKIQLENAKQNAQNKTQKSKSQSGQHQQGLAKAKPKAQARQANPAQHKQGLPRAKEKAQSPKPATRSSTPQRSR
jgi:hypothetical protein